MQLIVVWTINNKNLLMIGNQYSMMRVIMLDRWLANGNLTIFTIAESRVCEDEWFSMNNFLISVIQTDLNMKTSHFIEETLRSTFEYHYKSSNTEDWNSMKNSRSLAITCSLATYLKRCDIKKCGNIPLEKIPKFLDREQKGILAKLQRTTPVKKVSEC